MHAVVKEIIKVQGIAPNCESELKCHVRTELWTNSKNKTKKLGVVVGVGVSFISIYFTESVVK